LTAWLSVSTFTYLFPFYPWEEREGVEKIIVVVFSSSSPSPLYVSLSPPLLAIFLVLLHLQLSGRTDYSPFQVDHQPSISKGISLYSRERSQVLHCILFRTHQASFVTVPHTNRFSPWVSTTEHSPRSWTVCCRRRIEQRTSSTSCKSRQESRNSTSHKACLESLPCTWLLDTLLS